MDLAVDDLNRRGGIRGRPLRVLFRDSASNPAGAVAAAEDLFLRARVPAVIGPVLSSETLAVAPIAERERRVLLSPASSSPKITGAGDFVFRIYPSDVLEGAYMAEFALRELHLERIALLAVSNEYGKGLGGIFRSSLEAAGRGPVLDLEFPERDADYPALVREIRSREPDGVYLVSYDQEAAAFLREHRRQGGGSTVLGVAGFHSRELLRLAGGAAEAVIFPYLGFDPESRDPRIRQFVEAYRGRYGVPPDDWAAHGYDAVMILAEAIARAGETPDRLRGALMEIRDFPGVAGVTRFDANGDVVKYPKIFIVHRGEFIPYRDYLVLRATGAG